LGLLRSIVLPFAVGGMATIAFAALYLGAKTLLDRGGEMAFPTVVAEYFWIGVWVVLAAIGVLVVGCGLLFVLARQIVRPISRLAEAAERAAVSNDSAQLDERIGIDELHRLAVSFNHLLDERARKSEEIRNLSRNVLHDLRAPLSQIYERADHLSHDIGDKEEAVLTIQSISRSLMRIVEANAEISRNYSGHDNAPAVSLDLTALVREVAELYEAAAETNGLMWACSLPDVPVPFCGHENKIRRLVGNLLDNAIKYTSEGGRVSVKMTAGKCAVRFEVSDSGMGIPKEDQDNMYERFYRSAQAEMFPGTGLGLSMVHSIVAYYHGEIACDSAVGRGTTFRVTLPLVAEAQ